MGLGLGRSVAVTGPFRGFVFQYAVVHTHTGATGGRMRRSFNFVAPGPSRGGPATPRQFPSAVRLGCYGGIQ